MDMPWASVTFTPRETSRPEAISKIAAAKGPPVCNLTFCRAASCTNAMRSSTLTFCTHFDAASLTQLGISKEISAGCVHTRICLRYLFVCAKQTDRVALAFQE